MGATGSATTLSSGDAGSRFKSVMIQAPSSRPGILIRKRRSVAIIATIAVHFPAPLRVSGQATWQSIVPIDLP